EEAEILFAIGRDLTQHRDTLVSVAHQPGDAQSSITAAVPVAESKAVVARQSFSAGPADERHLEFVGERGGDDRVVRAVGTSNPDTALIDEILESVRGIASRASR